MTSSHAGLPRSLLALVFVVPLAVLAGSLARAQGVVIHEILAGGGSPLADEDGDDSDWIELFSPGPDAAAIAGAFLTDDPADPTKWRLPLDLPPLAAGEFLIVFASGKNRATAGSELHTSYGLAAEGEYVGLFAPDGFTVLHEIAPAYPRQRAGVSYGVSGAGAELAGAGWGAELLVPQDGSLDGTWHRSDFVPGAGWTAARVGVGYDAGAKIHTVPEPRSAWSLDGTTADAFGPNDGVFRGGAAMYVKGHDGASGGALDFDGSDDYVEVVPEAVLPAYRLPAYTIAMWVKGLPQGDKRVYSEGSRTNNSALFTIGTERTGSTGQVDIFIRFADGSGPSHIISNGVAFDGTWHHIAWTDAGGDAALYIDGVRDPVDFSYSKSDMALDIASIGCVLRGSACCFFAGEIDDVALWDEVLGEEAIAELAGGSAPGGGSPFSRFIESDIELLMAGEGSSLYARIPFDVQDPAAFDSLLLRMRYNDGFIAYLNGTEVARRNAPASPLWSSTAPAVRSPEDSLILETIDLSGHLALLRPGANVLALHGLNAASGGDDFLLSPELFGSGALALDFRYFRTPTPWEPNRGEFIDFVGDTAFSVDRGFYTEPFDVEITTETPGAVIRYTLDGTAPTASSGTLYTGPLRIARTTVLRAAAYREGHEPSNVDTHTYLFLDDVIRQPNNPPGYPSTWAGYPADYAMDPEICTDLASPHFQPTIREDLKAIPTMSIVMSPDDFAAPTRGIYTNPQNRGLAWERAASVELIVADASEPGFQVDCGVRMQGGSSARAIEGKHSFRLLFKSAYGPSKLRYRFFPDSEAESFDGFVLRCFSTDAWAFKDGGSRYRRWDSQYIRDLWMKDSQLAMGQLSGHNRYVHLYVNGLYWGLYNPSERPDDDFHALYQGGQEEDWDVLKDFNELFRGNRAAWDQLFSLANAGLSTETAYQRIQGNFPNGTRNPAYPVLLDADNLIDYMILHLYACAEDWPHHNWYAARSRTGDLGGFRFFVWDQEIVMDFVFRDRTGVNNDASPARLYSQLRANPEFRVRFGDRVQQHLFHGGALAAEEGVRRWMRRANEIDRAIVGESARWGDYREDHPDPSNSPATLYTREDHWLPERDRVIGEYIPESNRLAIARFRTAGLYPSVEPPVLSQHGGWIDPGFELTMTATGGMIYYTLDGTDPRLTGGGVSPAARLYGTVGVMTLLASGVPARALVPVDGALGLSWTAPAFDDSGWRSGTTGVGYERTAGYEDLIGLDMQDVMDGVNTSVYIRIPFNVDELGGFDALILRMKYDDGFTAYLNGEVVARRNAPDPAAWNAQATTSNGDAQAVVFEDIDISEHIGLLRAGENLLAVHGLNSSPSSSDMLILPEIAASRTTGSGVRLDETTRVLARAQAGGEWSALLDATFITDAGLRITEIMYHPAPAPEGSRYGEDEFEFIELYNAASEPLHLEGVRFVRGIEFDFTASAVTRLEPGEVVVLVENLEAFASRYDLGSILVAGQYGGRLENSGEELHVLGPLDETLFRFEYDPGWYPETAGTGPSLIAANPEAHPLTWGESASWRPSDAELGSPGTVEGVAPQGGRQLPGDATQDGWLDISDAVRLLGHLFLGSPPALPCDDGAPDGPGNRELMDLNGDTDTNLSDAIFLLTYLFQGGPPPLGGIRCRPIEGCPPGCVR